MQFERRFLLCGKRWGVDWLSQLEANWPALIETAAKLVGFVVIVGSPLVALWKQIRTRTYAVRPEINIAGKILQAGKETLLFVEPCVKNVGVSRIVLKPEISYIRVLGVESLLEKTDDDAQDPVLITTLPTLTNNRSVESGLKGEDSHLVDVPHDEYLAFLVEFGFTSKGFLGIFPGQDWKKTTIINCKLKPQGTDIPELR